MGTGHKLGDRAIDSPLQRHDPLLVSARVLHHIDVVESFIRSDGVIDGPGSSDIVAGCGKRVEHDGTKAGRIAVPVFWARRRDIVGRVDFLDGVQLVRGESASYVCHDIVRGRGPSTICGVRPDEGQCAVEFIHETGYWYCGAYAILDEDIVNMINLSQEVSSLHCWACRGTFERPRGKCCSQLGEANNEQCSTRGWLAFVSPSH